MTQGDVMKLLEKSKKPLTSKEINKRLKIGCSSDNLRKLEKQGLIRKRKTNKNNFNNEFEYWA